MLRGAGAIAKFIAVVALVVGAGAAALFAGVLPTAQAQTITDYDVDDNGLIEVGDLAQLNAMRWDLDGDGDPAGANAGDYLLAFPDRDTATSTRMGCPSGNCAGYELAGNLTFGATSTWTPIADFAATLDGGGHTITGLNINVSSGGAGMFSSLTASARIRDLGLVGASVTSTVNSTQSNGILAGSTAAGVVLTNVYASGGRITVNDGSAGTNAGGLVGYLRGGIYASYATAAVTLGALVSSNSYAGGLAGRCDGCTISTSYSAGAVTTPGDVTKGGMVGDVSGASSVITNSYCDTQATGQANCIGGSTVTGINTVDYRANTAAMQTPAGYTGLYLNWNLDTDGDGLPDYPWNFGTSGQYPTLYTPAQRAAVTPAAVNYDADGDNLISIFNLAQLSALIWDADGDGSPTSTNANAYSTAFAGHTVGMGCDPACAGYELAADLTFPSETSSPYNPWTPIPAYNALLDGNGRAITNLTVEQADNAGLFATLGGSSTIRNLALINPRVTLTIYSRQAGALVGHILPGARGAAIESVAVLGGRIAVEPAATSTFSSFDVGGLAGRVENAGAIIRNSYSSAEVATAFTGTGITRIGGLVGDLNGQLINTYAYGRITEAPGGTNIAGGLVGNTGNDATSTASYCDTQAAGKGCVGNWGSSFGSASAVPVAQTTEGLQTPTDYTGIYAAWAPAPGADSLWDFGTDTDYPALYYQRQTVTDSPPPGGPRYALPPQDTPYDPAADHPERYVNDRYEMAATCEVQTGADGAAESSRISFDLGSYQGAVILHLAIWNGEFFMSYESQDIPMPDFQRNGQTATVRVTTDPAQTRFLLDSVSPTMNLVLGYADCHTDDPGAADTADPAESATTSTAATPPAPKVYVNDRHEMTAACDVLHNADGEPDGAVIRFDLGRYQGAVILHLSRWNGEYYASYESLDIDVPPFQRNGQTATVRVATDPAETRFLLDSVAPTTNLLLGYADCHTAGE